MQENENRMLDDESGRMDDREKGLSRQIPTSWIFFEETSRPVIKE